MRYGLLATFLGLAACTTVPAAPPATETYRALGTEPFWSVAIESGQMRFETPEGGFTVAAPAPRTSFNGHRWETRRLTVDVTHAECNDGMSDRRFADTVMVIADGRELRGCGGDILAPTGLADTNWSIVAIDGQPVLGERYQLQFTADRLSGQAGCNRLNGSYSQDGETLTIGPVASTRMACPGPAMDHERRALQVLSGTVRATHPDGDTLELSGNGGTIRLRRSI